MEDGGAVRCERDENAEGAVSAAENDEGWFRVFGVGIREVGEDLEVEFGGKREEGRWARVRGGIGGHTVILGFELEVLVIEILIRVL